jgi:spore coat protein U-like protein
VELILGLWLLSGLAQRWARYAALAFFGILAAASLMMALEGRSHCGCFGRVEVNPWWTFGLDVAAVALLASFQPAWSADLTIPQSRLLRMAAISVLWVGLLLAGFFVAVASPSDWLAQWRGQTVTVEPTIADLGTGWPGEVRTFTALLTNRSTSPVRIVGGTARCGCTVTRALPVELAPGETKALRVEVRFLGTSGRFTEAYQLYTDAAGEWAVVARFRGRVMQLPTKED